MMSSYNNVKIRMLKSQYKFDSNKVLTLNGFIQDLYKFNEENNSFFDGEVGVDILTIPNNIIDIELISIGLKRHNKNFECVLPENYKGTISSLELLYCLQFNLCIGSLPELEDIGEDNVFRALIETYPGYYIMIMGNCNSLYGAENKYLESKFINPNSNMIEIDI